MGSGDSSEPSTFRTGRAAAPVTDADACEGCGRRLADAYYEADGQVLCPRCARSVDTLSFDEAGLFRLLKATLYGLAAAVGGTVLIYLCRETTGWGAGVMSIVAGYMVGSAVQQGSGYRGGRVFQVLAIFLTYSALSWSFLPELVKNFVIPQVTAEGANAAGPEAEGDGPGARADAGKRATGKAGEGVTTPPPKTARPGPPVLEGWGVIFLALMGVIGVTVLLAVTYLVPAVGVFAGMPQGLLFALVLFWSVQTAWRITRKVDVEVQGPYRVRRA